MVSDSLNNYFARQVYNIEPSVAKANNDKVITKKSKFTDIKTGEEYKVIEIKEDPTNGMQAMAVAPLINGEPDKSQIVIAYAGTNPKDLRDLATDGQSVVVGSKQLNYTQTIAVDGQIESALLFAKEIKDTYKDASISTTGHSLGEYLAMITAAENHWPNTGFNGPDGWNNISPQAKKWVLANSEKFKNFRNSEDIVGIVNGNQMRAGISIDMGIDGDYSKITKVFGEYFKHHDITQWKFDDDGNIIIPKNGKNAEAVLIYEQKIKQIQYEEKIKEISKLRKQLKKSGGGLSSHEKIYLNDVLALNIVTTASSEFHSLLASLGQLFKDGITEAEELWNSTLEQSRSMGTHLSESEIQEALSTVGFTEERVVTSQKEKFAEKLSKVNGMTHKFDDLQSSVQASINKLVAADNALAKEISA